MKLLYIPLVIICLATSCKPEQPEEIRLIILDDDSNSRPKSAKLNAEFYKQLNNTIESSNHAYTIEYYNIRLQITDSKRLEIPSIPESLPAVHSAHKKRKKEIKQIKETRIRLLDTFFQEIIAQPVHNGTTYSHLHSTLRHILPSLDDTVSYSTCVLFMNTDMEDDTRDSKKQYITEAIANEMNSAVENSTSSILIFTETDRLIYDTLSLSNEIVKLSHPQEFCRKLNTILHPISSSFTLNQ